MGCCGAEGRVSGFLVYVFLDGAAMAPSRALFSYLPSQAPDSRAVEASGWGKDVNLEIPTLPVSLMSPSFP